MSGEVKGDSQCKRLRGGRGRAWGHQEGIADRTQGLEEPLET